MFRSFLMLLSLICSLTLKAQDSVSYPNKLSPQLSQLLPSKKTSDSIDASLSVKKGFSLKNNLRILAQPVPGFIYIVRTPVAVLLRLAEANDVHFISLIQKAKEELTTGASDPTLNQITYVQNRYPGFLGDAITASVKERLFDSTDIDFLGRILFTGLEANQVTAHASLMTTIIAGAGNSSPFARGAAPGAKVTSSSFANLFPDPDPVFRAHAISVQNHSYGTVVENFYGNEAAAYDQNANANPSLLHVFSAGNSGTATDATGPYAAVSGMANLTGNLKQAKNIITVSAVDSSGKLLPPSGKGPAYDGRIKPELVAYGEDGSSGAAALVSGATILVQEAYARAHAGALPPSALTKAVLLNSADDAGEKHPDFLSGYGLLNANNAVQTVMDNRFFEATVSNSESKTFTLTVPPNTQQLKLTLTWNDVPALPNTAKALVNDLDLELKAPSGQTWLPWILDHRPSLSHLLEKATRGRDTLNNNEQITVEQPDPGTYSIVVKGSRVGAPQAFALAYELDSAQTFYWTYPTGSDPLLSGRRQMIRWHTNMPGGARVEYATSSNNWRVIGTVDTVAKNFLRWQVPDTVTKAILRLVAGNEVLVSDTFSISPQISLRTGFNCPDSVLLYWQSLSVPQYRLYRLGEKYLEAYDVLSDTLLVLQKAQQPSLYYAVAPLLNGKEGIRSNTINYQNQGVACYLRSFYLQSQTALAANFVAELGTLYQVQAVRLEKLSQNQYITVQTISGPQATRLDFTNIPVHPGENRFRLAIQLTNGATLYSIETVYAVAETAPVFFYPNPVEQQGTLTILTLEVGRYSLHFIDAVGRIIFRTELNESVTRLPANRFGKGMLFIRIHDNQTGKSSTQTQLIR